MTNVLIVLPGLVALVTGLDVVWTIGEVTMTGVEGLLGCGEVEMSGGEVVLCNGKVRSHW